MEPLKRRRKVKQLELCSNCLRNNHSCQGKHNTLIHINATIHQFKEHTIGISAIEEPDKTLAESSVKETNDALGVTSILNTTCLISNQEDSTPVCLENQNLKPLTVFLRIEQILKQQPQVYQTYKDSMQEYLDLGYINEVKEN
ncbi:hypothetical protein LAZ67_7001369 [Cordylochernes scorpioides]|uniref:Zn(2)-C6 fungal-type domain-containing protein n=1 Tax=Cordylochernes scorpioides TaxID=51811 RepID=A0ABY6KMB2_9ARAC|nr:hypothetical protein LAZ67_7001369 [Cordylochernes scorpioides]